MSKHKSQTTNWKEHRRFHALKLKRKKWKQRDIATALDVSEGAVSQWLKTAAEEGTKGLQARPHTGRTPELTIEQKQFIPDFLSHGAEAYGFRGEVWTCARIRKVIEWEYGVSYHKSHVVRLLKDLKWTPQMPVERATQRNELVIMQWRNEIWIEMKKSPFGTQNPRFCGRIGLLPSACNDQDLCANWSNASLASFSNKRSLRNEN